MSSRVARGRLKLGLVALVFLLPLALAAWLYFQGTGLQPQGRTNAGRLLEPIVNIDDELGTTSLAALTDGRSDGRWLLVYSNPGDCDARCEGALYRMRQSRLMLGREMDRLVRVFLHGDTRPDRVLLKSGHEGLVTTSGSGLRRILERKRPGDLAPGGLFLIDPLGNLVMYFADDLAPEEMVDDIGHLLELSRIG